MLRNRKREWNDIVSDTLYCLAIAITIGNMSTLAWKAKQEINIRNIYHDEFIVDVLMTSPKYLKVSKESPLNGGFTTCYIQYSPSV